MNSLIGKLTFKASNAILTGLSRSNSGRKLIMQLIDNAQLSLGIGTGHAVETSGERAIFEELRRIAKSLARPLCVFDVGANQGQFLNLTQQNLEGLAYQVHCFEPSPVTYKLLVEKANGSHVVFNPFGLGEQEGEFPLFSDAEGSGMASLSKRRLDHFGIDFNRTETVRIQTLDAYCQKNGVEQIDLLKLDVEGHELDVLKGASAMFGEKRISMVTFEFGGCHIDSRTFLQDFFYLFKAHGMTSMFRIVPTGALQRIDAYDESLEQFRTTNYLVLRGDLAPPE